MKSIYILVFFIFLVTIGNAYGHQNVTVYICVGNQTGKDINLWTAWRPHNRRGQDESKIITLKDNLQKAYVSQLGSDGSVPHADIWWAFVSDRNKGAGAVKTIRDTKVYSTLEDTTKIDLCSVDEKYVIRN